MFGFSRKKIPVSMLAEEAVLAWDADARRSNIEGIWPADSSALEPAVFDSEHLALTLFRHVAVLEAHGTKKDRIEEFIARFVELGVQKIMDTKGHGSSNTLDTTQVVEFSLIRLNRYLTRMHKSPDWFVGVGRDFAQFVGTNDFKVSQAMALIIADEYKQTYDFMKDFLREYPIA